MSCQSRETKFGTIFLHDSVKKKKSELTFLDFRIFVSQLRSKLPKKNINLQNTSQERNTTTKEEASTEFVHIVIKTIMRLFLSPN